LLAATLFILLYMLKLEVATGSPERFEIVVMS